MDTDGLDDFDEVWTYHTDYQDNDSDDDGWTDKEEVDAGTDPNDETDYPVVSEFGYFFLGIAVAVISTVIFISRRRK